MSLRKDAMRTLDVQLDLLNYYGSREGRRMMTAFLGDQVAKDVMPPPPGGDPDQYAAETGVRLAYELHEELGHAASYYLTPEMMALALHAGETVPGTPFTPDSLPTPSGFVLLPAPFVVIDRWNKRISCRAMAWWTSVFRVESPEATAMVPTMVVAAFSTKVDRDVDDYMAELHRDEPEMWLSMPGWSVVHWAPIYFGAPWAPGPDDPPSAGSIVGWLAFLKTFFLLVRQNIAVARPERPDRAHARRPRGIGLAPEFGEIQIVTLRRTRPVTDERTVVHEGGGSVEWSHRWIVSGFWSDQFHPSCARCQEHGKACRTHEKTWVESFIKGPPDRPLIVKDRVFIWKR